MSTTGQAFVKAFARREKPASQHSSKFAGMAATGLAADSISVARTSSQADSTRSRVLPSEGDPFIRVDIPDSTALPQPSSHPVINRQPVDVAAMQHMHTAYEPPTFDQRTDEVASEASPLIASWEIDVFDVPQTVADLFFEEGLFNDLADRMQEANQGGLQTMLVTSLLVGEGRTTVAIGIAMTAAASGMKVALIDANFQHPTLADDFRLDLDFGWIDHIRDRVPLGETAVHAVEDNVTLFPLLAGRSTHQATAQECRDLVARLRSHFDLILIDGDIVDDLRSDLLSAEIESAIIVYDPNQSSEQAVMGKARALQSQGVSGIGCVENFA